MAPFHFREDYGFMESDSVAPARGQCPADVIVVWDRYSWIKVPCVPCVWGVRSVGCFLNPGGRRLLCRPLRGDGSGFFSSAERSQALTDIPGRPAVGPAGDMLSF